MNNSIRQLFSILLIVFPLLLQAQSNNTITGYVYDSEDDLPLVGANVVISEISQGTTTGNGWGFSTCQCSFGENIS